MKIKFSGKECLKIKSLRSPALEQIKINISSSSYKIEMAWVTGIAVDKSVGLICVFVTIPLLLKLKTTQVSFNPAVLAIRNLQHTSLINFRNVHCIKLQRKTKTKNTLMCQVESGFKF